jgi:anthranilate synthase/aminodeoxychorismate synthase-like glutamine amidotransferase
LERGPYTGSLGRVTFGGDACFNILIRSVVIDGDRHHVQVGGGIVHDSDPAAEHRETGHKARAVLAAYDGIEAATPEARESSDREDGAVSGGAVSGGGVSGGPADVAGMRDRDRPAPLGADVTVAVIDNRDSFAQNLAQGLGRHCRVAVGRYDEPPEADGVVFSPGPGRPEEFPVMDAVLEREDGTPVLGVCLGHQAIARHFGGTVVRADAVVHGKTSRIEHDGAGLFTGLPDELTVGRYHSLVVGDVPGALTVTARGGGEVMGLRHPERPLHGVQFHPESFLTPTGERQLRNFVALVEAEA